jgi:lipopolysaccharide transport system permease protein
MTRREVDGRYKGSLVGLGWSFFNPILMLAVYTFVFSFVFKARWGVESEGARVDFALILFIGLIMHGLLAEVLNQSHSLILINVNYVKKVVFSLEILPVVSMGAALFHAFVSIAVLLFAFFLFNGFLHWTIFLIVLVLMPLIIILWVLHGCLHHLEYVFVILVRWSEC